MCNAHATFCLALNEIKCSDKTSLGLDLHDAAAARIVQSVTRSPAVYGFRIASKLRDTQFDAN